MNNLHTIKVSLETKQLLIENEIDFQVSNAKYKPSKNKEYITIKVSSEVLEILDKNSLEYKLLGKRGRKKIPKEIKKKTIFFCLSEEEKQKIEKVAKKKGVTTSKIIRNLIKKLTL